MTMLSDRAHRILTEPISVGLKVMPNRLYRPPGVTDDEVERKNGATGAGCVLEG